MSSGEEEDQRSSHSVMTRGSELCETQHDTDKERDDGTPSLWRMATRCTIMDGMTDPQQNWNGPPQGPPQGNPMPQQGYGQAPQNPQGGGAQGGPPPQQWQGGAPGQPPMGQGMPPGQGPPPGWNGAGAPGQYPPQPGAGGPPGSSNQSKWIIGVIAALVVIALVLVFAVLKPFGQSEPEQVTEVETTSSAEESADVSETTAPESASPTNETTPEEEEPTQEASTPAVPVAPPTAPPTGPLDGTDINAAGAAWFGAFCSGISEIQAQGNIGQAGLSTEEVQAAAVDVYDVLSSITYGVRDDLSSLDTDMNFEGAPAYALYVANVFQDVGDIYVSAGELIEGSNYQSVSELQSDIDSLAPAVTAVDGEGFGVDTLDPTVADAVFTQVESCVALGGG